MQKLARMTDELTAQRFRALGRAAVELDGQAWYAAEDVFAALGLNARWALRKIRRENKRREYVYAPGFRSRHRGLLNRAGVETAILIAGGHSRKRLMDALDGVV